MLSIVYGLTKVKMVEMPCDDLFERSLRNLIFPFVLGDQVLEALSDDQLNVDYL